MAARMRDRARILSSLESVYREAFEAAREKDDAAAMARLDFEFQRDQLHLEVLLDIREALAQPPEVEAEGSKGPSLLDKAQALRNLARLR